MNNISRRGRGGDTIYSISSLLVETLIIVILERLSPVEMRGVAS